MYESLFKNLSFLTKRGISAVSITAATAKKNCRSALSHESLDRIRTVRAELDRLGRHSTPIEVDGGVDPSNAALLKEAGAEILVAGSSVFRAPDPAKAIELMRV